MYKKTSVWRNYYWQIEDKPFVSILLIAANVIVYVLCAFTGDLLYNGGGISVKIVMENGEVYRILTAMFLHADISHLVGNMIMLGALGDMLESKIGHGKYLVIYFLSGIGAHICSMSAELFTGRYTYSVGASGAVYGICGAMLGAAVLRDCRDLYIDPVRVILVLAYSLYSGFRSPQINNVAHIGGVLCGFIIYFVFYIIEKLFFSKRNRRRLP